MDVDVDVLTVDGETEVKVDGSFVVGLDEDWAGLPVKSFLFCCKLFWY